MNARADESGTALVIASIEGHVDVVRTLIEKGADVTMKDHLGRTALRYASQFGYPTIVQLLRGSGARE